MNPVNPASLMADGVWQRVAAWHTRASPMGPMTPVPMNIINPSRHRAEGVWQRGMAYKSFGPSVTSLEGVDLSAYAAMQEMRESRGIQPPMHPEGSNPLCIQRDSTPAAFRTMRTRERPEGIHRVQRDSQSPEGIHRVQKGFTESRRDSPPSLLRESYT